MMQQQADAGIAAAGTAAVAVPAALAAGFDPLALTFAATAAVAATFMFDLVDTRAKAFAGVVIATLLGGYGAPAVGEVVVAYAPTLAPAMEKGRLLVTLLLGFFSPVLLPGVVAGLKRRSERMAGGER